MRGQWIGEYSGTNAGNIVVNIDEFSLYFQGVAYLLDSNPLLPGIAVFFRTKEKINPFTIHTTDIVPINPKTGNLSSWEEARQFYGHNVIIPTSADAVFSAESESISLTWTTSIGTSGKCTLPRSKADKPSELVAREMTWNQYKEHVATLEGRRFLFRGQNSPKRLRTGFHRSGRADLHRFLSEDVQILYKHLSARTKHVFNLNIPDQNGAFLNLAQHHGYPTPLLDWSYSPYVAAFFSYRGVTKEKAPPDCANTKVRIHMFDHLQWKADLSQLAMLVATSPHVSIHEFIAIENERLIPQQAVTTVTNLDDIETYIKSKEIGGKRYLMAIDLPTVERRKVVQELSFMGITAGSLFPGLDGACEELRERNFNI